MMKRKMDGKSVWRKERIKMKKIALLLVMSMVLSMTACGKKEEAKTEDKKTETESNAEENTTEENQEETTEDEAAATNGTVGQTLLADFMPAGDHRCHRREACLPQL